jgi:hypothetical protein
MLPGEPQRHPPVRRHERVPVDVTAELTVVRVLTPFVLEGDLPLLETEVGVGRSDVVSQ